MEKPQAKRLLAEWIRKPAGRVWCSSANIGRHLDGGNVLDVLYAAMEKAGIPRVSERRKADVPSVQDTFAKSRSSPPLSVLSRVAATSLPAPLATRIHIARARYE